MRKALIRLVAAAAIIAGGAGAVAGTFMHSAQPPATFYHSAGQLHAPGTFYHS